MQLLEFEELLKAELKANNIEVSYLFANDTNMRKLSVSSIEVTDSSGNIIKVPKYIIEKYKNAFTCYGFLSLNTGWLVFNSERIQTDNVTREKAIEYIRHELAHILYYSKHKIKLNLFRFSPGLFKSLVNDGGHNAEWRQIYNELLAKSDNNGNIPKS